jgi:hypothetical protein
MKVTEVQGAVLGVVHLPGAIKPWRLTIQDPDDKSVLWVDLTDDVAKQIVEKLTSGIVVAKSVPH